ncbi:MAG: ATP-binding protein [Litoreibacter sp.]|nr:ATP-binding protein [Litoreibacter sp.]
MSENMPDTGDPGELIAVFRGQTGGYGIRMLMADIREALQQQSNISEDLLGNVELIVSEVLNNIEEHSYQSESGCPLRVAVSRIGENNIQVETQDFGEPMPGLRLPAKSLPNTDVAIEDLPEGGFGWFLIHTLAPQTTYTRNGQRNILTFSLEDG